MCAADHHVVEPLPWWGRSAAPDGAPPARRLWSLAAVLSCVFGVCGVLGGLGVCMCCLQRHINKSNIKETQINPRTQQLLPPPTYTHQQTKHKPNQPHAPAHQPLPHTHINTYTYITNPAQNRTHQPLPADDVGDDPVLVAQELVVGNVLARGRRGHLAEVPQAHALERPP